MQRKVLRLISALLTASMIVLLVVGCGTSGKTPESTTTAVTEEKTIEQTTKAPEPLKEVTLKFYFAGDKLPSTDEVWNEVSNASKEKLNAKFEINYVPWGDYVNKIMVMAASGDKWDLNFAADWLGYAQLINGGAFKPLNDLLPKYAPELYAKYNELGILPAATVSGNILSLPWTMKQNARPYIVWRKDLSPEIAVDSVKTIEDLDSLLTNAKAKFTDLRALNVGGPRFLLDVATLKYELADTAFHEFYFDINDSAVKVVPIEQTQAFKEAAIYAKKWYDANLIAKDAIVDKTDMGTYWDNGLCYSEFLTNESSQVNMEKAEKSLMSFKTQRFERSQLYPEKKYFNRTPLANAVAIGKNSENPERTLMFCNMMETDKKFYDLVMYGILGKTYVLNGEAAEVPAGVTTQTYLGWTSQWAFWKPQFMRPDTNYGLGFWQKQSEFANTSQNINSPIYGLFLNSDAIKTEISKRDQLFDELAKPILFGLSKNVEKDIENYIAKQKEAGSEKITAEIQKQIDDFLASKK